MKRTFTAALLATAFVIALGSASYAATYKSADSKVLITAPVIEFSATGVNAKGGAHIEATDPRNQSRMEADAKDVSVTFSSTPGGATNASSIKKASMKGGVHIVYNFVENGTKVSVDSKCDEAIYTGADQMARLTGNVRIVYTNPALFDGPSIVSGDKATVNTKPALKDDEFRFRIESAPGLSKVEITPKTEAEKTK